MSIEPKENSKWFKSLSTEQQKSVRNLVLKTKEEYIADFFEDISVYETLNENDISVYDIYYDTEKYPTGILIMAKEGEVIDVRTNQENNASVLIKEIIETNALAGIEIKDLQNKNIDKFFEESQALVRSVYISGEAKPLKENKIITSEVIYQDLLKEFGLEHLESKDQEEMLFEMAKTIQKQFLIDVYEQIDEEKFKALEASVEMGEEFYDTTLKHLVPTYDQIFKNAREKVVSSFKKTS